MDYAEISYSELRKDLGVLTPDFLLQNTPVFTVSTANSRDNVELEARVLVMILNPNFMAVELLHTWESHQPKTTDDGLQKVSDYRVKNCIL